MASTHHNPSALPTPGIGPLLQALCEAAQDLLDSVAVLRGSMDLIEGQPEDAGPTAHARRWQTPTPRRRVPAESTRLRLSREWVSPCPLVRATLARLRLLFPDITITFEARRELPPAYLDSALIAHVIAALVRGAGERAPAGSEVRVVAALQGVTQRRIFVSVCDQGPAIDQQRLECYFEPEAGEYGLARCRAIVEAHGGQIWVASSASRGTRITFTLPAPAESQASA